MKTMKLIMLITLMLTTVNTRAELPELRPYVGLDYLLMNVQYWGNQVSMQCARFKLGAELNSYLALEGHAGFGITSDGDGRYHDWSTEKFWGLYSRGILPLHERVKLYGIFGITTIENEISESWGTGQYSTSGWSYGLGFEAFPLEQVSVSLEFMSLIDELNLTSSRDDTDTVFSSVSAGLKYYF